MDERPIIAISLGDPAGIGPEIVARALGDSTVREALRPLVFGDARVLERALKLVGSGLEVAGRTRPAEARWEAERAEVLDLGNADPAAFEPGAVSALCGKAAWEALEAAATACLRGEAAALDTAPINKESIAVAGVPYIGHTEMLEAITGSADPLTMFETLGLRVFFLSRHVSLSRACELVTKDRLLRYIERCLEALRGLGIPLGGSNDAALAVAGLNPHCGEHGLFGDEEGREIEPAVAEARARGLSVLGPIGADSVFHQAKSGRYAAVLSLYHDQGHIATKTLDFDRTISLTLGLPFLRTSVDHGTAFDIAWKAEARAVSMVESLLVAARYARRSSGLQ